MRRMELLELDRGFSVLILIFLGKTDVDAPFSWDLYQDVEVQD